MEQEDTVLLLFFNKISQVGTFFLRNEISCFAVLAAIKTETRHRSSTNIITFFDERRYLDKGQLHSLIEFKDRKKAVEISDLEPH